MEPNYTPQYEQAALPGASNQEQPLQIPVVGIGASAGGLVALKQFFTHMPAESGMAFVVILYLSPDYDSNLAAILQQSTAVPVVKVIEQVPVEANHVYVIPPTKHLAMLDGTIKLTKPAGPRRHQAPIDLFFRLLAETYGRNAAAIVLSGSGADGTIGAPRLKENGGLVLAQNPSEAEYDAMPRSLIATGLVDLVLPVAKMPDRLIGYWRNAQEVRLSVDEPERRESDEAMLPVDEPQRRESDEAMLRDIFAVLRTRTSHDFSQYKRPTVLRRIGRRMQVNLVTNLADYLAVLHTRPDEVQALLRDLLISVTNFFRDHEAWQTLEQAIPQLFAAKQASDFVRVWVVGCATGEEAYSIAMLLYEYAARHEQHPTIQIFATDIDEDAIGVARQGLYPDTIAVDITTERLQRFFTPEQDRYRIRKEIRDLVLFAPHNILRDPPFSKLDLITCRNLLIYFNRDMQEQVLHLFYFTLRPDGYLLLGASESTDGAPGMFSPTDKVQRVFQRRMIPTSVPNITPNLPFVGPARQPTVQRNSDLLTPSFSELDAYVLTHYGPAMMIVNEQYEIVYLARSAGQLLSYTDGTPSHNLLKSVHPDLRLELRTALFAAVQQAHRVETRRMQIEVAGEPRQIHVVVQPLDEPQWAHGYIAVIFHQMAGAGELIQPLAADAEPIMRQIEEELQRTKDQLRMTIEQYETANEEHKAANEELQAINEELRVATEELETSKEELQSVNEELLAVNQELKHKVDEVSQSNNDLQNLMASTEIGTLFIDRELRVKRYTPSARAIFNLIPSDINRPLSDVTNTLNYTQLAEDAAYVLETLSQIEREALSSNGNWYLARLRPYRTSEARIDGVVLTFVDITKRRQAEEHLRASEERLRLLIESVADYAIITIETEGCFNTWNTGAGRMFGYAEAEVLGKPLAMLSTPEDRAINLPAQEQQQALSEGRAASERWHVRKDGTQFFASCVMTPLRDGSVHGFVKIMRDLTDRKQHEDALQSAHESLEARVEERTSALAASNTALQAEIVQRTQAENARQGLIQQLVTVQEEERQRIARELHDQLGQQLSALRVGLAALHNLPQANAIARLQQLAAEIDEDVDRLALELRPSVLDDLGLVAALQQHVDEWVARYQIATDFQSTGEKQDRLAIAVEIVLYRMVQEALNNVVKHANAQHVSVILEQRPGQVQVIIEDDGQGFEPDGLAEAPDLQRKLGLLGMRERAALVGGTLTIESAAGRGTTVFIRIPLSV